MNTHPLHKWLSDSCTAAAGRHQDAVERERRQVALLEAEVAQAREEPIPPIVFAALRDKEAALDAELLALGQQVTLLAGQLYARAQNAWSALQAAEAEVVLTETQALFDQMELGYLRQPLLSGSAAVVNADLEQSALPAKLQQHLEHALTVCAEHLAEVEAAQSRQDDAARQKAELERSIDAETQRLMQHGVSAAVINSITRLDDQAWFFEEVVEPYTAAAIAESEWQFSADFLKGLQHV